jgi:hypothetical protein
MAVAACDTCGNETADGESCTMSDLALDGPKCAQQLFCCDCENGDDAD